MPRRLGEGEVVEEKGRNENARASRRERKKETNGVHTYTIVVCLLKQ